MLPTARTENLTVQQMPDEALVFDHTTQKAHCLNRTSAFVWKCCDGKTTPREMAARLKRDLGVAADEAVVSLALEQLARRNLLTNYAEPREAALRRSRRDALKKLALTAASLPVVMTLTAKAARAQSSKPQLPGATSCTSDQTRTCSSTCQSQCDAQGKLAISICTATPSGPSCTCTCS